MHLIYITMIKIQTIAGSSDIDLHKHIHVSFVVEHVVITRKSIGRSWILVSWGNKSEYPLYFFHP